MGGTVAETIRKENGEVVKMARKTGAYNWMIFSKDFNNGQMEKAVDEHIEKFLEMKQDFESGEPYQYPMSGAYGWCNETAPISYGLVVLDFQKKKIHSMQGYDTPATLTAISCSPYLRGETLEDYKFLAQNNLLEVHDSQMNHLGDVHSVFGSTKTFEAIQKMVEEDHSPLSSIKSLLGKKKLNALDTIFIPKVLNDFELKNYEESPEGLLEFLRALKADGFEFNEEEVKMWKEHFEEFEEYAAQSLSQEEMDNLSDGDFDKLANKFRDQFFKEIDDIVSGLSKSNSPRP